MASNIEYFQALGSVIEWICVSLKLPYTDVKKTISRKNIELRIITELQNSIPVGNYMFKVNNRITRTSCEICSKLTIKTPCYNVSVVNFEQVNGGWDRTFLSNHSHTIINLLYKLIMTMIVEMPTGSCFKLVSLN